MIALRSLVTYLVISDLHRHRGPDRRCSSASCCVRKAACTRWGTAASGLRWRLRASGSRVAGREHVPGTAVVFCSNHESNVDPPVLFEALHPRLHVLYKAELRKFPIMGTVFDVGGFVAVDRGDREKAFASIAQGADVAAGGQLVPHLS